MKDSEKPVSLPRCVTQDWHTVHTLYTSATHINPALMKTEFLISEKSLLTIWHSDNKYNFHTPTVTPMGELSLARGSRVCYLPLFGFSLAQVNV